MREILQELKARSFHLFYIFIAVATVFGNSLRNGFVWDDTTFIVGNRVYQEFDLQRIFFSLANGVEYFPLRDISLSLDYAVWGENSFGFHLTNLVLYFFNAVIVYFLSFDIEYLLSQRNQRNFAQEKLKVSFVPLFATFLFIVHPIHCEVVNFITQRNALLSGMFFFMSCYLFLKFMNGDKKRIFFYSGSLICYLLALLSKATVIILPLILFLFTIFGPKQKRHNLWLYLIPFFLISAGAFLLFKEIALKVKVIDTATASFGVASIWTKIAIASQIPFFYLGKLFFPIGLSANYDIQLTRSVTEPLVIVAIVTICCFFCGTVYLRTKFAQLLFSFCWYIIALIPVLNFFQTNPTIADRYAYLPSYAFFFLIASLSGVVFRNRDKLMLLFGTVIIIFWSILSIQRNNVWASDKKLWEETIKTSPRTATPYINLGLYYTRINDFDKALPLFLKAREFDILDDRYDYWRGYVSYLKGDLPSAVAELELALLRQPDSYLSLLTLGAVYEQLGEVDKAADIYNRVLQSKQIQDSEIAREMALKSLQQLRK